MTEVVQEAGRSLLGWRQRAARYLFEQPARRVSAGFIHGGLALSGHLATMMLSCDWKSLGRDLPTLLVKDALSISGVSVWPQGRASL